MAMCRAAWLTMVLAAIVCVGVAAQEAKPWEQPGTKVGEKIIGPDGGRMVWVPPGEFMMGSNDGGDDEKPVHRVRITRGFWLGKHTVTNQQYQAFCTATARTFPMKSREGKDHPVVRVSWEDAEAYCQHYGLALPTEAQWEYAARGAAARKYPWGDAWDPKKCCNRENLGPGGETYPVGSFAAGSSWCGALDLAGNVWEWCADWYDGEYYQQSPEADPAGPASGYYSRVLRGGSYNFFTSDCRSANRQDSDPEVRLNFIGFRVARTP